MSRARECSRPRILLLGVAALVVAALAPPARAGDIILFNPTGGGTNPSTVLNVSSFAYNPGTTVAIGGAAATVGSDIPVLYQSFVQTINTSGGNTAGVADANTGTITINGTNTNTQIVATAAFTERLSSVTTDLTANTQTANFSFVSSASNSFNLYAVSPPTANLNSSTWGSFSNPILTGQIVPTNFVANFSENRATDPRVGGTATDLLDSHDVNNTYPGVHTIAGTGNTSATVLVTFANPNYFPTPPLGQLVQLNFNTISNAVPFRALEPATVMFNGYAPNVGAVNGVTGPDFLFQSQANNDFTTGVIPEPASVTMAATALGIVPLATWLLRRRTKAPLV